MHFKYCELQSGSVDAQYNSARVLRHLAMSGESPERTAVLEAIPALVEGLQVAPRLLAGIISGHFKNG